MIIGAIENGLVLDHITAGRGMELYRILGLDTLDCEVALIKNAQSVKMGRKDIIKVDRLIDVNLDAIGYVDPGITVNVIQDGKLVERKHIAKPDTITNVIKCKNPRCITTVEQEIPHVFKLVDRDAGVYRCIYCESKAK
ncbi:MAG: aspartate carbamoyltransferase regulatory subunit [Clostridiales bacterium]|nr:aspartate carbamoyltransferase regulatory subunit [Clostridiales bacterium]MDD6540333.1 aspartate carbamoyltransferase regulatory subunit [Bacillota bacterium]MDD7015593.1 aspartate carbamoyltransferase regulatory subunit [Bacillota bacterium]MDY4958828.1 aspartate carbamoyltransferase regulatory subunit [Lentihominibacter sp.]